MLKQTKFLAVCGNYKISEILLQDSILKEDRYVGIFLKIILSSLFV
jgi:hypothetical protein